jgi:hypothetical protein
MLSSIFLVGALFFGTADLKIPTVTKVTIIRHKNSPKPKRSRLKSEPDKNLGITCDVLLKYITSRVLIKNRFISRNRYISGG